MNQQQAVMFANYLSRAVGVVPTTMTEAAAVGSVLNLVHAVAAGAGTVEFKPAAPAPKADAPATPPADKPRDDGFTNA